jgi:hypothetical protein
MVSSNSGSPTLTLPPSEQVAANGTVDVTGASYSDSFAQGNAGAMYVAISDSAGLLSAYYADPAVPGSDPAPGTGTHSITFQGSFNAVEDIINSLTYAATTASGSDTIRFDVWNQAGVETTGSVPVAIGNAGTGGGLTETWNGVVDGNWNNAANWSGGAVPTSGDTVVIPAGTPNNAALANATLAGESITLADDASGHTPTVNFTNVTLGAGTTLQTSASSNFSDPILDVNGTFTIASGATIATTGSTGLFVTPGTVGETVTVVNDGVILHGATIGSSFNMAVTNDGTIVVDAPGSSTLSFASLINAGTVTIDSGRLGVSSTISGGTIDFAGRGTLLVPSQAFVDGAAVAGFGQGDAIDGETPQTLNGNALSLAGGTLDILSNGALINAVPMVGSYGLGNFQINTIMSGISPGSEPLVDVYYAPDGGPSDVGVFMPDISAPASGAVAQGGTLDLGSVSIANAATLTLDITAQSGTLSMDGASGSGTNHLTISTPASGSQINADLATLTYVPAAGSSSDAVAITANEPSNGFVPSITTRIIPVAIAPGSGPMLNEPSGETVAPGASVAVSGSYSDSLASSNAGAMYLHIGDTSGSLAASYPGGGGGVAAPGSGSNSITFQGSYADVQAILNGLTYTAAATGGSDTIAFDVWNQAGVETTGSVPVTVMAGGGGGGGGGGGPVLTEPSSVSVAAGGTVAVSGSDSDSFAQANPGALYLGISDTGGTLTATDASGHAVAGSGSNSIALSTDYVDVNAILGSLHYTAGASGGSDTIRFDVWNQAGVESTAATAVTIEPATMGGAAPMLLADFAGPSIASPMLAPSGSGTIQAGMVGETTQPPIGVPLTIGH